MAFLQTSGIGAVVSADIAGPEHERELRFYSSVLATGESPRALPIRGVKLARCAAASSLTRAAILGQSSS
jgi:pyruvate/2-oxoglutarate dehydrogenase complex dihydrolipoamide dehydrogenase (E3) component